MSTLPFTAGCQWAVKAFQGLTGLLVQVFLMLESLFPEAFRYRRLDQEKRLPLADDEFKHAGVVLDEVAGFHSPGFTVDSVGTMALR